MNAPERTCEDFHDGKFNTQIKTSLGLVKSAFERKGDLQIENYNGKIDSFHVKWVNDCEYVLYMINPKSSFTAKPSRVRIIATDEKGYDFEYNIMKDNNILRGRCDVK